MNRQLAKKRLIELEQQAEELKKRKRLKSSAGIQSEDFTECYNWLRKHRWQSDSQEPPPDPIPFVDQVDKFFAKFNDQF